MRHLHMRVVKYIPDRFYGFCADANGMEIFFHLGAFNGNTSHQVKPVGVAVATPVPPVLGEEVSVEMDDSGAQVGQAPRAHRVMRLHRRVEMSGTVLTYDARRGFGFVGGDDGVDYHLHNSEVLDGALPVIGSRLNFFPGVRRGRPRACHVKVCR